MESTLLEHRSIKLLLIDKVIGDFFFFFLDNQGQFVLDNHSIRERILNRSWSQLNITIFNKLK